MKTALIALLPFLTACSMFSEKAIEDFIEGEAKVAETVVEDLSGNPHTKQP